MTHWLILKTDQNKEFTVAQALSALGHEVWVPSQIGVRYETFTAGPGLTLRRAKPVPRPLMPSVVLAVHTPPPRYLAAVDHLNGIWRDNLGLPRLVPHTEVETWQARIDEVNAAEVARIRRAQLNQNKKRHKKTVKLDPNLADAVKDWLFGQREQEAA